MFEEIVSFESFALFVFLVALAALLAWRQMREAAEHLEDKRDEREEDAKVTQDFRAAMAEYNDTEHQAASMEPFCGGDKQIGISAQEFYAKKESDRQERSRQAIRRAQQAAHDSLLTKVAARSNPFILTPEQEQEAHECIQEQERRDFQRMLDIQQHNSSFRALGITPLSIFSSVDFFQIADTSLENGKMLRPVPPTWDYL